jgi:predicted O-methyltransferase YrrM
MESHEKERFLLGKNTFEKAGFLNRVTQILGHAPEAIPSEKMSTKLFDLVFLDATKYEYPSYFDVIKNRVKKNGFVIADNANSHAKELKPYFKKVLSDKNWHSVKLDIGAGIMVSLKIL